MQRILLLLIAPLLVKAQECVPGSRVVVCSAVDGGKFLCKEKICDSNGHWQPSSSSSSSSSASSSSSSSFSSSACAPYSRSTTCFKPSADEPLQCSRRVCDSSTRRWASDATRVAVARTTTLKMTGGCFPGMVIRDCVKVVEDVPSRCGRKCVRQVCGKDGQWGPEVAESTSRRQLAQQGACFPKMKITECDIDAKTGSCRCFRQICGDDGVWGPEFEVDLSGAPSTSLSAFASSTSSSAPQLRHEGACSPAGAEIFECIGVDDGPLQCVRQICDPSTGRWGPEQEVVIPGGLPTAAMKALTKAKVSTRPFGMECIPGSYIKECAMIEDGILECITTVCDWNGMWKEKSREIFN